MPQNPMASLLNDQSTSDFIIKCRGHRFYVHKLVLCHRSDHFRAMLSNSNWEEGNSSELDITEADDPAAATSDKRPGSLPDDDPYLFYAFLEALYTNDYPNWCDSVRKIDGGDYHEGMQQGSMPPIWDEARFHVRMSELAHRYFVKGLDNVIAKKLFFTNMENEGQDPIEDLPSWWEGESFHANDGLKIAIETVFNIAKRNLDFEAQDTIAKFVVDHLHHFIDKDSIPIIPEAPGLFELVFKEQLDGQSRLQCPACELILRIDAEDLGGSNTFLQPLDAPTADQYVRNMWEEHVTECPRCYKTNATLLWYRAWLSDPKDGMNAQGTGNSVDQGGCRDVVWVVRESRKGGGCTSWLRALKRGKSAVPTTFH